MAFQQARKGAEMMEYEWDYKWDYRYGDFVCGTWLVEEEERRREEGIADASWVEPVRKRRVEWECKNWGECWRAWPWKFRMGE